MQIGKPMNRSRYDKTVQIKKWSSSGHIRGKIEEGRNSRGPPRQVKRENVKSFVILGPHRAVRAGVTQRLHGPTGPWGWSLLREVALFTTVRRDRQKDVLRKYPGWKDASARSAHSG